MLFLTDFADLGLVLPLAALVALSLAAVGWRREALAWSAAVAGTLAAMLALKLLVLALPGHLGAGMRSPSGHTAAGTVLYAGLLALLAGRRPGARAGIALLAGVAMALLFGATRLAVGRHTLPEVLVGGAVGLAGALASAWLAGPRRPGARAPGLAVVAAVALLAVVALHGQRLHAEPKLRAIAAEIRSGG